MPSFASQYLVCITTFSGLFSQAVALDCPRGGISNTTAVRKTYPIPPAKIFPVTGDFFDISWSTIEASNFSGLTHPPKSLNATEETPQPNATRVVSFDGYEFKEQLIFLNDTAPDQFFNLRWNLTNPPVTKDSSDLTIDSYIQDFKFTAACDGKASLLEWTVEYCSNNQDAGWELFENRTTLEADNLAATLDITGADDGTWDVGCALPTATTTFSIEPTESANSDSETSATAKSTSTSTQSGNGAMATAAPVYGGALVMAVAAVFAL